MVSRFDVLHEYFEEFFFVDLENRSTCVYSVKLNFLNIIWTRNLPKPQNFHDHENSSPIVSCCVGRSERLHNM